MTTAALYESKPMVIEAVRWTGDNLDEVIAFAGDKVEQNEDRPSYLKLIAGVDGASGPVDVPAGHWVARKLGDPSDYWPVEHDHFTSKYDRYEDGLSRVEQLEAALALMFSAFDPATQSKVEFYRDIDQDAALRAARDLLTRP